MNKTLIIYLDKTITNCVSGIKPYNDPVEEKWKDLKPFPDGEVCEGRVMATAVWKDTILFNLNSQMVGNTWAYDVKVNEWYPVVFEDFMFSGIVGEAVVIGDIIYALTEWSVLALSIRKGKDLDGYVVFECSIIADNKMDPILFRDEQAYFNSRHLVHLGKDEFCVVQSCYTTSGNDCQPIQVTYIKIEIEGDHSMTVMDEYFHQVVKVQHGPVHNNKMAFDVLFCFSLSNGPTTPLKKLKRFYLDFLESIPVQEEEEEEDVKLDNDSSQTNVIDAQGLPGKFPFNTTVYVRNLPPKATVSQLEKGLTKFGPIKSGGIQVLTSKRGKRLARVEFKSYSSWQCAIEASAIRIGDCQAEITERGLTEGDCNRTPSTVSSTPFLTERMGLLIADKQRDWLDNQRITLNRIMAGMVELAEKKGIVLETDLKPETTPYLYMSEIEDKLAARAEQDALDADEGDDGFDEESSDAVP